MTVTSQRPVELLGIHLPLALVAAGLRAAHLPWRWVCRPAALRAIARADVVADISGISFVDGRRKAVLLYNTLLVAVPLLLGRPVVKCAQAMGPVRTPLSRRMARLVLPRLRTICPRGTATEAHLRELGLTNLVPANDLAFVMDVPDEVRTRMRDRLAPRPVPARTWPSRRARSSRPRARRPTSPTSGSWPTCSTRSLTRPRSPRCSSPTPRNPAGSAT